MHCETRCLPRTRRLGFLQREEIWIPQRLAQRTKLWDEVQSCSVRQVELHRLKENRMNHFRKQKFWTHRKTTGRRWPQCCQASSHIVEKGPHVPASLCEAPAEKIARLPAGSSVHGPPGRPSST